MKYDYDLLVLGSGPAGQKAAIAGAKMGKRVGIIEPRFIGGICTHRGTVPSKTIREAAIQLTDYHLRYMDNFAYKPPPSMEQLMKRVQWVINTETDVIRYQLEHNHIKIIPGFAKYRDSHHVDVFNDEENLIETISCQFSVICTGTEPFLLPGVPFDEKKVFYTDNVFKMPKIPRTLSIVGGGIIGCEYASIFSILGVKVNLIEAREDILALTDREIRATLVQQLDLRKVNFCMNECVTSLTKSKTGDVEVHLNSGKVLKTEMALFCTYRVVNTEKLDLDKVDVELSKRGVITVDKDFRTSNKAIFAAGDVVGSPALASTSFEQGRIAATRAFNKKCKPLSKKLPIGIYTIPEISFVGPTEGELTKAKIPYVVGKSKYKETSRGAIIGALDGFIKLIFHQQTHEVLAVHCVGESASELVHIGQAVIELGGKVDYFTEQVFNYPTLAEIYKYAAFSGLNRDANL